jgi:hypothetical protein
VWEGDLATEVVHKVADQVGADIGHDGVNRSERAVDGSLAPEGLEYRPCQRWLLARTLSPLPLIVTAHGLVAKFGTVLVSQQGYVGQLEGPLGPNREQGAKP